MNYTNGLAKGEFLRHMFDEFPSVFSEPFSREMLENIVDYGTADGRFCSMNSLYYFLTDMIPEIEPQDLLPYMDSNVLTDEVLSLTETSVFEPEFEEDRNIHSMDELKERLEENGWRVVDCEIGPNDIPGWDIGQGSPAGEDFWFSIEHNNDFEMAIEEIKKYAYDFNINEHAEFWIEARHSEFSGVPDVQTLVEDAKAIQSMLNELAAEVDHYTPSDIDYSTANFLDDEEKMRDFATLSKAEFLASYSYLTEAEYDNTMFLWREQQAEKPSLDNQISGAAAKKDADAPVGHQNNKDYSI